LSHGFNLKEAKNEFQKPLQELLDLATIFLLYLL